MKLELLAASIVGLTGLGLLYVLQPGGQHAGLILQPEDPAVVARGSQIYASACAACHGADAQGQTVATGPDEDAVVVAPPHDGSGHTWRHPETALFEITKYGSSDQLCAPPRDTAMPDFAEALTDEDIISVLSYVKSLWPEDKRRWNDEISRYSIAAP